MHESPSPSLTFKKLLRNVTLLKEGRCVCGYMVVDIPVPTRSHPFPLIHSGDPASLAASSASPRSLPDPPFLPEH